MTPLAQLVDKSADLIGEATKSGKCSPGEMVIISLLGMMLQVIVMVAHD